MERYPSGACPAGLTALSLTIHYIRISEEEQVQPHLLIFLIFGSLAEKRKSPLPSLSGKDRAADGGADAGVASAEEQGKKNRQAAAHAAACPYKGQVTKCTYERSTAGASFFTLPAGQCCPVRWRSRAPPLCTAPALPAAWSPCPAASPSAWRPSPPDGSVPGSARCP